MKKIVIFYHICAINNYKEIVRDQVRSLKKSGLVDVMSILYITILGKGIQDIITILEEEGISKEKYNILYQNIDIRMYEFPILDLMHSYAQTTVSEEYILYFHAKATSQPDISSLDYICKDAARKCLEYFVIDHYKKCVSRLNQCDIIGTLLYEEPSRRHFMGNFWWSKTSYIKKLPPCSSLPQNSWGNFLKPSSSDMSSIHGLSRIFCEYWICLAGGDAMGLFNFTRDLRRYPLTRDIYGVYDED